MNYYRLRQIDFDDKEELSKVVSVDLTTFEKLSNLRAFPNPVSSELTLLLPENTAEEIIAQLFSPTGQLLQTITLNIGTNALNINGLEPGIYTLKVISPQGNSFEKIVVQ